jgi:hypothetical protein
MGQDDEEGPSVPHHDMSAGVTSSRPIGGPTMAQRRTSGFAGTDRAPHRPPEAHREHVVRRLLAAGLSAHTLVALLPDFRPIVHRVLTRD